MRACRSFRAESEKAPQTLLLRKHPTTDAPLRELVERSVQRAGARKAWPFNLSPGTPVPSERSAAGLLSSWFPLFLFFHSLSFLEFASLTRCLWFATARTHMCPLSFEHCARPHAMPPLTVLRLRVILTWLFGAFLGLCSSLGTTTCLFCHGMIAASTSPWFLLWDARLLLMWCSSLAWRRLLRALSGTGQDVCIPLAPGDAQAIGPGPAISNALGRPRWNRFAMTGRDEPDPGGKLTIARTSLAKGVTSSHGTHVHLSAHNALKRTGDLMFLHLKRTCASADLDCLLERHCMFKYLQSLSVVLPGFTVLGTFVPGNRNAGGSAILFRRLITMLLWSMEHVVTQESPDRHVRLTTQRRAYSPSATCTSRRTFRFGSYVVVSRAFVLGGLASHKALES